MSSVTPMLVCQHTMNKKTNKLVCFFLTLLLLLPVIIDVPMRHGVFLLVFVLYLSLMVCCVSSESSSQALSMFNKSGLLDVVVQCLERHPQNVELAISAGRSYKYMLIGFIVDLKAAEEQNVLLYIDTTGRCDVWHNQLLAPV